MPDVVWLATGGKNICLNSQTIEVLRGRDIADFLLATPSRRQILCRMIERNPNLRQLIDELDLELVEE